MSSTRTTTARPRAWIAGGAVTASALLLVSCTASEGGEAAASGAASPSAGARRAAARPPGQKLGEDQEGQEEQGQKQRGEQAQAVLGGFGGGAMVEAGTERVADGIHTEPLLRRGRAYRLDLVCVGRGSARVVFTPAGAGTEAGVPCDRSVVWQRFTPHGPVRIDVDGVKGSTGAIAWVIREVGHVS